MRDKVRTHKDLEIWKRGIDLVAAVYAATKGFPREELYGLVSQLRRTAISIPSNVAEGAARHSTRELIQFLYISSGSASELETQLMIAKNLNFLSDDTLFDKTDQLRRMITSLIKSLKRKRLSPITNH